MRISLGFGVGPVRVSVPLNGGPRREPKRDGSGLLMVIAAVFMLPLMVLWVALFGVVTGFVLAVLTPLALVLLALAIGANRDTRPEKEDSAA